MGNPRTRWLLILTGLVLVYALVASSTPEKIDGPGPRPIRFFRDNYDMSCYFRRGAWLPLGKRPYAEVFSEYPQLATYLFGLTHVVAQSNAKRDASRRTVGFRLDGATDGQAECCRSRSTWGRAKGRRRIAGDMAFPLDRDADAPPEGADTGGLGGRDPCTRMAH